MPKITLRGCKLMAHPRRQTNPLQHSPSRVQSCALAKQLRQAACKAQSSTLRDAACVAIGAGRCVAHICSPQGQSTPTLVGVVDCEVMEEVSVETPGQGLVEAGKEVVGVAALLAQNRWLLHLRAVSHDERVNWPAALAVQPAAACEWQVGRQRRHPR